jgi:hypothetical protein
LEIAAATISQKWLLEQEERDRKSIEKCRIKEGRLL